MSERAAALARLGETWFASELPDHARRRLAELGELRRYEPGEEVTREGDEATELGVVVAGRLALRMLVPERGMVTICLVGALPLDGHHPRRHAGRGEARCTRLTSTCSRWRASPGSRARARSGCTSATAGWRRWNSRSSRRPATSSGWSWAGRPTRSSTSSPGSAASARWPTR